MNKSQIWYLSCQSLRIHFRDYRLLLALIGMTALMLTTGLLFVLEHSERSKRYVQLVELGEAEANLERLYVARPPSRLGFIAGETRERFLEYAIVRPHLADLPSPEAGSRPLIFGFEHLDWRWVLLYFYSFIAIIMTYDSVSGERERGTLKLIVSKSVSRLTFLASRYISAYGALLVPLGIGSVANILILLFHNGIEISLDDFGKASASFVVSAAFLSFIVLCGIAASVATRQSSSSLAVAVVGWAVLAFLLPGLASTAAEYAVPSPTPQSFRTNLAQLHQERDDQVCMSSGPVKQIVLRTDLKPVEKRVKLAQVEEAMNRRHREALEQHEVRVAGLRKDVLSRLNRQEELKGSWSRFSPFSLYGRLLERIVRSDWSGQSDFFRLLDLYSLGYTEFVEHKRRERFDEGSVSSMTVSVRDQTGERYTLKSLGGIAFDGIEVDASEFPKFHWREERLGSLLGGAAGDLACLLLYQVVLMAVICWRFYSYDVR